MVPLIIWKLQLASLHVRVLQGELVALVFLLLLKIKNKEDPPSRNLAHKRYLQEKKDPCCLAPKWILGFICCEQT